MNIPKLPEGHRHLWKPERAKLRGYWLVLDDKGYEYALGCRNYKDGRQEVSEATDPDGQTRKWTREDGKGEWTETTASSCLTRWLDSVPNRLRSKMPWFLPDGTRAMGKRNVKEAVDKWVADPLRGTTPLCLWGPPGTGKSQTAVWVGMLLAAKGINGEWLHLATGAQALRRSYDGDRQEYSALVDRWLSARFLVVDDLGAEIAGKDVAELLYRIADSRYNSCLSTVWTSNVSPMLLADAGIDPRTVSRITAGFAVELSGSDRRKRKDIDG